METRIKRIKLKNYQKEKNTEGYYLVLRRPLARARDQPELNKPTLSKTNKKESKEKKEKKNNLGKKIIDRHSRG